MEERTDYFAALRKISSAFGTTLDRDELLELIVQSAIDIFEGRAASLFLIDEESNEFVRVAQRGLSEDYLLGPHPAQEDSANFSEGRIPSGARRHHRSQTGAS